MAESPLIRVLRAEMRQRGLTQNGLALAAGLHQDAVRNIFRGTSRIPRMETVKALADYLGVTVDYLLGREPADAASPAQEVGAVPTIPSGRPGPEEWEEVRRFWSAASADARRALVYLVRTMARSEAAEPPTNTADAPDKDDSHQ
jgi:transcriptional regulator with XRE-family HTH domain